VDDRIRLSGSRSQHRNATQDTDLVNALIAEAECLVEAELLQYEGIGLVSFMQKLDYPYMKPPTHR
jgi:hypothetical protein